MYLDFIAAKNDYIAASRRAFACNLAAATGGNISVRIPARIALSLSLPASRLGSRGGEFNHYRFVRHTR